MHLHLGVIAFTAFIHGVIAEVDALASTTCGKTYYSSDRVNRASQAACNYVRNDETAGDSSYPHRYQNFEGFAFHGLEGPLYEFPILSSGRAYLGQPGPDRVIITEDCQQAGQLTHTGANGNSFIGCRGTD